MHPYICVYYIFVCIDSMLLPYVNGMVSMVYNGRWNVYIYIAFLIKSLKSTKKEIKTHY